MAKMNFYGESDLPDNQESFAMDHHEYPIASQSPYPQQQQNITFPPPPPQSFQYFPDFQSQQGEQFENQEPYYEQQFTQAHFHDMQHSQNQFNYYTYAQPSFTPQPNFSSYFVDDANNQNDNESIFQAGGKQSLPSQDDIDKTSVISNPTNYYQERKNIEQKELKNIVTHLLEKIPNSKSKKTQHYDGKKKKKVKYGNDQLVKKIVRKMCDEYSRQFRDCYENELKTIEQAIQALVNYLTKKDIPKQWIDVESEDFKVMKQFLLPLNAKRLDPCFGQLGKRGQNARNEFLSKGTKKEGIKFFSNRLAYSLMWKDFQSVCNEFINSQECEDKEKVETFLKHLTEKLDNAKAEKEKKVKESKKNAFTE